MIIILTMQLVNYMCAFVQPQDGYNYISYAHRFHNVLFQKLFRYDCTAICCSCLVFEYCFVVRYNLLYL